MVPIEVGHGKGVNVSAAYLIRARRREGRRAHGRVGATGDECHEQRERPQSRKDAHKTILGSRHVDDETLIRGLPLAPARS